MSLFNKYDEDGGGSIDIFEFIDAMLPRDFPKRTVDTQYTQNLQTDRATRHANNIQKMLKTPPQTKSRYEGPKVEIPPGYGGHIPGFCERFAVSYGQNALSSLVEPQRIISGDFREVSSRGKELVKG